MNISPVFLRNPYHPNNPILMHIPAISSRIMNNLKNPEKLTKKCDFQKWLAAGGSAQRQPGLLDCKIKGNKPSKYIQNYRKPNNPYDFYESLLILNISY